MPLNLPFTAGRADDPKLYEWMRAVGQQALKPNDIVGGNGISVTNQSTSQTPRTVALTSLTSDWNAGPKWINSLNSGVEINGLQYGLNNTGTVDNTATFNALIAWMELYNIYNLFLPHGNYLFNSKPNIIKFGLRIRGEGIANTNLFKNYNEATNTNGFLTWDGSSTLAQVQGGGFHDAAIYANNTTGGIAILLTGASTTQRCSRWSGRNVWMTLLSAGSWFRTLVIDGSAITTAGSQGVRDCALDNVFGFASTDGGNTFYFNNAVNLIVNGGGVFSPSAGRAGVNITGTNVANGHSTNVALNGLEISGPGDLNVDYADHVFGTVKADGNATITANAGQGFLTGVLTGTLSNSTTAQFHTAFSSGSQPTFWLKQTTGVAKDILIDSSSTKGVRLGLDTSDNGWVGSANATPFQVKTNGTLRQYFDTAGLCAFGNNTGPTALVDVSAGEVRYKVGSNIASASTISPAVGAGNVFHVTGTTTINTITARSIGAGDWLTLIADGAWAFGTSGNIKATKSTMVANDAVTLFYDGTNWYQVNGPGSAVIPLRGAAFQQAGLGTTSSSWTTGGNNHWGVFEGTSSYPANAVFTLVTLMNVANVATTAGYRLTDQAGTTIYGTATTNSNAAAPGVIATATLSSLPATRSIIQEQFSSSDNVNTATVYHSQIVVTW